NSLVFGDEKVVRSVAVPFVILAAVGAASARLLKAFVDDRYDVKSKTTPALTPGSSWVLVVGGAGYIGSLLVERLLEKGHRVRVLDNLLYGDEPLRPVRNHPNFELIIGDCRNIHDVVQALHGVQSVVHLAAIVGDPACNQDNGSALE